MPYRPFAGQNCSIAAALAVVGERWTMLVMREVLLGTRRFADIRHQLGVAPNILSDRLTTLVLHDLLARRRYGRHPEAFEYVATQKGVDLTPTLVALMQWGDKHAAPAGPPRVYVHTACGHDADPQLRCGHCGAALAPSELKVRPGPGANVLQRSEPLLPA
ncbi:MAG: helix-turn-helix transcriptional regulator [Acidobacteriota bacterium]|nr:helix-turn-helix transcriptional regulator [Acidobacteriota bacterium]